MDSRRAWSMPWVIALCLMGCDKQTPESGYRAFAEALREGDSRTAWASMSKPTRDVVERRAKEIADNSKGLIKNDPAMILLQSGTRPGPIGPVKRVSLDGGVAVIEVEGAKGLQQITMVREGDRWVVELSDILRETTAP